MPSEPSLLDLRPLQEGVAGEKAEPLDTAPQFRNRLRFRNLPSQGRRSVLWCANNFGFLGRERKVGRGVRTARNLQPS